MSDRSHKHVFVGDVERAVEELGKGLPPVRKALLYVTLAYEEDEDQEFRNAAEFYLYLVEIAIRDAEMMALRLKGTEEGKEATYNDFMVVKAYEREHVFRCPFCGKMVTRDYDEADTIIKGETKASQPKPRRFYGRVTDDDIRVLEALRGVSLVWRRGLLPPTT